MADRCCDWDHVRPCGEIPGAPDNEPVCACGCTGYDERCGTPWSNNQKDWVDS